MPHVYHLLQGDALVVGDRVTQPVDRKPPAGALGLRGCGRTAGAAQHGDQRGQLGVGGVPLEYLDVRLVRVLVVCARS